MNNCFPVDPLWNEQILPGIRKGLKIYYGSNKWGRKEWINKWYPQGTKDRDFLKLYVEHATSVMLNATHFQTYPPEKIKDWASHADGLDFKFCPKVTQSISHYSSFINVDEKWEMFLHSIHSFGEHLGPIHMRVSDRYTPKKKDALFSFLDKVPRDLPFFLFVANPDWYADEEFSDLLKTLKQKQIGLMLSDDVTRPDHLHLNLTIPKCMVLYNLDDNQRTVEEWILQIKEWGKRGLEEAYFFVSSENNPGKVPETIDRVRELINAD